MAKTKIIGSAMAWNEGELFKTNISSGSSHLQADEPTEFGGKNTGPSPADYLCMSLASCKAITIRMYVQRKGWQLHTVRVQVNFVNGDQTASGMNTFFCEVSLEGDLNEEQRKRILQIAKVCPVERLLAKPNEVVTVIAAL